MCKISTSNIQELSIFPYSNMFHKHFKSTRRDQSYFNELNNPLHPSKTCHNQSVVRYSVNVIITRGVKKDKRGPLTIDCGATSSSIRDKHFVRSVCCLILGWRHCACVTSQN